VSGQPFQVASLAEVETFRGEANPDWHRIRVHFGITSFGVNAWTATEPGQQLIGAHDEVGGGAGGHEELYVVIAGRARFTVEGEDVEAPAGTMIFVSDPAARRGAVAHEAGTSVLVVGGQPGEAFAVSPWEGSSDFLRYFETKEYDKAIEFLRGRLETNPSSAGDLYNLACAESLAGRPEDALEHLRRAVDLSSELLELAQTDSDLDAIRDHPDFPRPQA